MERSQVPIGRRTDEHLDISMMHNKKHKGNAYEGIVKENGKTCTFWTKN